MKKIKIHRDMTVDDWMNLQDLIPENLENMSKQCSQLRDQSLWNEVTYRNSEDSVVRNMWQKLQPRKMSRMLHEVAKKNLLTNSCRICRSRQLENEKRQREKDNGVANKVCLVTQKRDLFTPRTTGQIVVLCRVKCRCK